MNPAAPVTSIGRCDCAEVRIQIAKPISLAELCINTSQRSRSSPRVPMPGGGVRLGPIASARLTQADRFRPTAFGRLTWANCPSRLIESWHWIRNTQLHEDAHRYKGNGAGVMASLGTVALNLLRIDDFSRSVQPRRRCCTPSRRCWRWCCASRNPARAETVNHINPGAADPAAADWPGLCWKAGSPPHRRRGARRWPDRDRPRQSPVHSGDGSNWSRDSRNQQSH